MKSRLVTAIVLIVVALPLSGCPGASSVGLRLGIWLFETSMFPAAKLAVTLLPGGDSVHPDPLPQEADGLFSTGPWAAEAPTFLYFQEFPEPNSTLTYVGTILSETTMEGTFAGDESGTWTATFLR